MISPALTPKGAIEQMKKMKAQAEAMRKKAEAAAKKAGLKVPTKKTTKAEEEEYQGEFPEVAKKPIKKYLIIGGISLAVLGLGFFLIRKLAKRKK